MGAVLHYSAGSVIGDRTDQEGEARVKEFRYEQAQSIVARVCGRHNITPDEEQIWMIASGLEIASEKDGAEITRLRNQHEDQRKRIDRIEKLDAVIDAYHRPPCRTHLLMV